MTSVTWGSPRPPPDAIDEARSKLSKWAESQQGTPYMEALRASELNRKIEDNNVDYHWADVKIFYDLPEKINSSRDNKQLHMAQYLRPYFDNAKQEVLIISPYFVPGTEGTSMLCDMQNRGVKVAVLTNSLASTDMPVVHAGYLRYRKQLLKCGVQIFEANMTFIGRDTKAMEYQLEAGR